MMITIVRNATRKRGGGVGGNGCALKDQGVRKVSPDRVLGSDQLFEDDLG